MSSGLRNEGYNMLHLEVIHGEVFFRVLAVFCEENRKEIY